MEPRLYLLVDEKLPVGYQAAQCVHAGVQWLKENPDHVWQNDFVVLLKAKNIDKWIYKLDHLGAKYATFAEPDLNHQITAIATDADPYHFRNLKLVGS